MHQVGQALNRRFADRQHVQVVNPRGLAMGDANLLIGHFFNSCERASGNLRGRVQLQGIVSFEERGERPVVGPGFPLSI